MLRPYIRVLDFDASVVLQQNLIGRYNAEIIPLQDVGPRARLWLDAAAQEEIEKKLGVASRSAVTFLGSGDFHHISSLLLGRFEEPLTLIVFDFHPDWDILPPRLGCGSWVNRALEKKNVLKCILTGISSEDISTGYIQTGNLKSFRDNRVELYPYSHKPTVTVFKTVPSTECCVSRGKFFLKKIFWNELREKNIPVFFAGLMKRLPSRTVYISIDKDCLRNEYAITNWEEGRLTLEQLLVMIKVIRQNCDIIGADITGDFSPVSVQGPLKKMLIRLDHPKGVHPETLSSAYVREINEKTNLALVSALLE